MLLTITFLLLAQAGQPDIDAILGDSPAKTAPATISPTTPSTTAPPILVPESADQGGTQTARGGVSGQDRAGKDRRQARRVRR